MSYMEWATWSLVFLTGVLAVATIIYAYETHEMNKSSKKTQNLLEEQNGIMQSHNKSLREQSEALSNQTDALLKQAQALIFIEHSISGLPYDAASLVKKKTLGE